MGRWFGGFCFGVCRRFCLGLGLGSGLDWRSLGLGLGWVGDLWVCTVLTLQGINVKSAR